MKIKILYYGGYWLTRVLSWLLFRPRIRGRENIPREGGFIMASNHISYYDPPLVGSWQRRQVYFLAKKELFRNSLFGGIIRRTNALPVSRGSVDRQAIELAVEVIEKGYGLVLFPEGTRSRTREFLSPKPGIGIVATRAGCPIVPVYIHGSNRLRDCLLRRERMSITYGPPIPADRVRTRPATREGYFEVAHEVMEHIGRLRSQVVGVN